MKTIELMRSNGETFMGEYPDNHHPFTFGYILKSTEGSEDTREIMFHYFKLSTKEDALNDIKDAVKGFIELSVFQPDAMGAVSALSDMFNCISKIHNDEYEFIRQKVKQHERR